MAKGEGKGAGRPTDFTPELGAELCLRIATYPFPDNSITRICKDEEMPCRTTVYLWRLHAATEDATKEEKEFLNRYRQALDIRIESMLDESIDIVYDDSNDMVNGKYGDTGNSVAVSRATLKANLLKWALSKLKPEEFGESIKQIHSGEVTMNAADALIHAISGKGDKVKG